MIKRFSKLLGIHWNIIFLFLYPWVKLKISLDCPFKTNFKAKEHLIFSRVSWASPSSSSLRATLFSGTRARDSLETWVKFLFGQIKKSLPYNMVIGLTSKKCTLHWTFFCDIMYIHCCLWGLNLFKLKCVSWNYSNFCVKLKNTKNRFRAEAYTLSLTHYSR